MKKRLISIFVVLVVLAGAAAWADEAEEKMRLTAAEFISQLQELSDGTGEFLVLRGNTDYPALQAVGSETEFSLVFYKEDMRIYPQTADAVPDRIQLFLDGDYKDLLAEGTVDSWKDLICPLILLTGTEETAETAENLLELSNEGKNGSWFEFDGIRYKFFVYYPDLCDEYCRLLFEAALPGLSFKIDFTENF